MYDFQDLTIMYVEDDRKIRDELVPLLDKFFGEVIALEDGKLGLDKFKELHKNKIEPDIVLSDINMPNMNGLDMIKNIREIDLEVPILLMTAHSDTEYLLKAIQLQVSDYILKPMDVRDTFDRLKKAYLPIQQKSDLMLKNLELEKLNQKIKDIAHKEIAELKSRLNIDDFQSELTELFETATQNDHNGYRI
jgi:YesN/AraC family two-component response regulator